MIAVLDASQMREADRVTIRELGLPGMVLMEAAAGAVTEVVAERFTDEERVVIACGPGNNGGDGLAVARQLRCRGFSVDVALLVGEPELKGDAAAQLELARKFGVAIHRCGSSVSRLADLLPGAGVIVDALFGTGLDRPLKGRWAKVVALLNGAGVPVVAVDVPSGLQGSSGEVAGAILPRIGKPGAMVVGMTIDSVGGRALLRHNKPTAEGQYRHYKAIHDAVDLPILIYNIPGRSVVDMSVETMARLAELPRIVGVKDATADLARPLLTRLAIGPGFCQLSGEDITVVPFLAQGGHGCISVTANVAPRLCAELHAAWQRRELDKVTALNERLTPLHRALFVESSPGPVKYAASLLGRCAAELRLPLCEVAESTKQRVRAAMQSAGLLN